MFILKKRYNKLAERHLLDIFYYEEKLKKYEELLLQERKDFEKKIQDVIHELINLHKKFDT